MLADPEDGCFAYLVSERSTAGKIASVCCLHANDHATNCSSGNAEAEAMLAAGIPARWPISSL
eukprot:7805186-Lingulodinium_polyedra.AAC.1